MKTKTQTHTPGPWKAEEQDIYGNYNGKYQLLATAHKEEKGKNTVDDGQEAWANADLIASAPDLLAAAKDVITWDKNVRKIDGDNFGIQKDVINFLEAAIAKAEGR